MKSNPKTTDEYPAVLPDDQGEVLEDLRTTIREADPEAQESVSSGVPAFRHRGKYLVSYGAAKRHAALHVMRGFALEVLEDELGAYDASGTVVRFAPNEPLRLAREEDRRDTPRRDRGVVVSLPGKIDRLRRMGRVGRTERPGLE